MDLKDQLKNLFPDHVPEPEEDIVEEEKELYVQKEPNRLLLLKVIPVQITILRSLPKN